MIPLLLLFVCRAVLLLGTPASAEDAFITFRYARNLASGQGLVYNPGEHVMGFTSPLWTVRNALGIAVIGNPIPWAVLWSVIADLFTLLVGGALVAATAGTASAWAFTFFFAAWPYFSALAVSGMEMSVCVSLIVLSAMLRADVLWMAPPKPKDAVVWLPVTRAFFKVSEPPLLMPPPPE